MIRGPNIWVQNNTRSTLFTNFFKFINVQNNCAFIQFFLMKKFQFFFNKLYVMKNHYCSVFRFGEESLFSFCSSLVLLQHHNQLCKKWLQIMNTQPTIGKWCITSENSFVFFTAQFAICEMWVLPTNYK